jgi:hypothetical protein
MRCCLCARTSIVAAWVVALVVGEARADDSDLTDLDRRVMSELSAQRRVGQIVLHYNAQGLTAG